MARQDCEKQLSLLDKNLLDYKKAFFASPGQPLLENMHVQLFPLFDRLMGFLSIELNMR